MTATMTVRHEDLAGLASVVVNDHSDQAGLCAVCGSAFPCHRAVVTAPRDVAGISASDSSPWTNGTS